MTMGYLDIFLTGPLERFECECSECGHAHFCERRPRLHTSVISHELGVMAYEAGIYEALWRPRLLLAETQRAQVEALELEENETKNAEADAIEDALPPAHARDLIEPLRA